MLKINLNFRFPGKTTLVDNLLASVGIISEHMAGKVSFNNQFIFIR